MEPESPRPSASLVQLRSPHGAVGGGGGGRGSQRGNSRAAERPRANGLRASCAQPSRIEEWLLDDLRVVQAYGPLLSQVGASSSSPLPRTKFGSLLCAAPDGVPWLEQLSVDASEACQIPASSFAQLLSARLSLITHELGCFSASLSSASAVASQPPAPAPRPKVPVTVHLGLTTFNAALRSLCADRHDLEAEVTEAVCCVLQGLPPLGLSNEDESLLDSLEGLFTDLVVASSQPGPNQDRVRTSNALTALVLVALLRGSLKSVLSVSLIAAQVSKRMMGGVEVDPRGQLRALREASQCGADDLSPLTSATGTLLRGFDVAAPPSSVGGWEAHDGGYSAVASDSRFLYVHSRGGMCKVGTGYDGSVEGKVYAAASTHASTEGWLVYVRGWLLFMPHEGGRVLYQISPKSLTEVGTLTLPVSRSDKCGVLLSDGQVVYTVCKAPNSDHHFVNVLEVLEGGGGGEVLDGGVEGGAAAAGLGALLRLRQVRSVRLLGPVNKDVGGEGDGGGSECDVYTCGQNRKGELGHNNGREQLEPSVVTSLQGHRIVSMAAGNESSYFLTEDGRVLSCGLNASGQLGRQTREEHSSGVDMLESPPDGKKVVRVCCHNGAEHALLLTSDGKLFACGCNTYGQLGTGNLRKSAIPVPVALPSNKTVSSVTCSYHHSVAVTSDGEAYAFGLNDHGQLGINSTRNCSTPQLIKVPPGVRISSSSCGQHHTVLLSDDGRVYSCGRNHNGQLGLGTREESLVPVLVESLVNEFVGQVACGYNHTCALVLRPGSSSQVYAFGYNHHGQLGLGHCESMAVPQVIADLCDSNTVKVSCGAYHTAVLTEDALVLAFGSNAHGQLGQGNTAEQSRPVVIPGLKGKQIADVACGFHHLMALSSESSIPAVDAATCLSPSLSSWYTDGSTLCVHFPSTSGDGGGTISRSFSLDTGAHALDEESCLSPSLRHATAFDRARGIVWVHSTSPACSSSATSRVSAHANIGPRRAAFLTPGTCLSRFPSIAEAFLSLPQHAAVGAAPSNNAGHPPPDSSSAPAASSPAAEHVAAPGDAAAAAPAGGGSSGGGVEAQSCALVVLALLDIISRTEPSTSTSAAGGGEALDLASWQACVVDLRPATFQAFSGLIVHCGDRLKEELARGELGAAHMCVFGLRMLRVNVNALSEAGTKASVHQDQASAALVGDCAKSLREMKQVLEGLLLDDSLSETPIHHECCHVFIEGQQFFHASGQERVDVLRKLLERHLGLDEEATTALASGERLLCKMLMDAVASNNDMAMALAPPSFAELGCEGLWKAHVASFRSLVELIMSILVAPDSSSKFGLDTLLASRLGLTLLKANTITALECKGGSVPRRLGEQDGAEVGQGGNALSECWAPLCEHIVKVSCEAMEGANRGEAWSNEIRGCVLLQDVLPWVITTSQLFLEDRPYAEHLMGMVLRACEVTTQLVSESGEGFIEEEGEPAVVESQHPYRDSEREVFHAIVPGASYLLLQFDSRSCLGEGDSLQIFSDVSCKKPVGSPMCGPFGAWPSAPWVIAGNACSVSFCSGPSKRKGAASAPLWGFRCVVSGHRCKAEARTSLEYVDRALPILAAGCARAMLLEDAEEAWGHDGESLLAWGGEEDVRLFDQRLELNVAVGCEEGSTDVMSLARERCSVLTWGLLSGEGGGAEEWLKRQVGEDLAVASGGQGGRQQVFAASCAAMACLVHCSTGGKNSGAGAQVASQGVDDAKRLWALAGAVGTWVLRAQQERKARLMEVAGVALEDAGEMAYAEVLEGVRHRACLVLASRLRSGGCSDEDQQGWAGEVVAFVMRGSSKAEELAARVASANAKAGRRKKALDAFCRILEDGWGGVGPGRGDAVRAVGEALGAGFLVRVPMTPDKEHRGLVDMFGKLIARVRGMLLLGQGGVVGEVMRLGLLKLLAGHAGDIRLPGEEYASLVESVWAMCKEQPDDDNAEEGGAGGSPREVEWGPAEGSACEVLQSGHLKVLAEAAGGELCLDCSYWCPVTVLEMCDGGSTALVEMLGFADGMQCQVPVSSLSAGGGGGSTAALLKAGQEEQAGGGEACAPLEGGEADVLLLCSASGEGVWVPATVEAWEEGGRARVILFPGGEMVIVDRKCVRGRKMGAPGRKGKALRVSVNVSRDMSSEAHITVSSAGNLAARLLDKKPDTYWQSDGSRPHWITLMFPRQVRVHGVSLFCDFFKDRSFTPKRVSVRGGGSVGDLRLLSEAVIKNSADGWTSVLGDDGQGFEGLCVRIMIHDNQDGGCNTRVRAVKVIASWASGSRAEQQAAAAVAPASGIVEAAHRTFRLLAATCLSGGGGGAQADDAAQRAGDTGAAQAGRESGSGDSPGVQAGHAAAQGTCVSLVLSSLRSSLLAANAGGASSLGKSAAPLPSSAPQPPPRSSVHRDSGVAVGSSAEGDVVNLSWGGSRALAPSKSAAWGGGAGAGGDDTAEWIGFLLALQGSSPVVRDALAGHEALESLHATLATGPPTLQQQALRLYRSVLPTATTAQGGSSLATRMLLFAGGGLCAPAAPPPRGVRQTHWTVGVQGVYLLRVLLGSEVWRPSVLDALQTVLEGAAVLSSKEELEAQGRGFACSLAAALAVLGGLVDGARPGAAVVLLEGGGRSVIEACSHDSASLRLVGGESVPASKVQVIDEVPLVPEQGLVRVLANALVALDGVCGEDGDTGGEAETPTSSSGDGKGAAAAAGVSVEEAGANALASQLRCMAVLAVCAHARSKECVSQSGAANHLLDALLPLSLRVGAHQTAAGWGCLGVGTGLLHVLLMEAFHRRCVHGERPPVGGGEAHPASRGAAGGSSSSEAARGTEVLERQREAARDAAALDLSCLGYAVGLCSVALRLNGEDPQAAASWLLDSSADYVEAHPEVLVEAEVQVQEGEEGRDGGDGQGDGEGRLGDTMMWQAYHLERGYEGGGGGQETGAAGSRVAGAAGGSANLTRAVGGGLRLEDVRRGQLLCVQDVPGVVAGDVMESLVGRCAEVRGVEREAKAVVLDFWDPLAASPVTRCTVPLSAVSRPHKAMAQSLGFVFSLRGAALWEAFGALQSSMTMSSVRAAICNVAEQSGELPEEAWGGMMMARRVCRAAAMHLSEDKGSVKLQGFRGKLARMMLHHGEGVAANGGKEDAAAAVRNSSRGKMMMLGDYEVLVGLLEVQGGGGEGSLEEARDSGVGGGLSVFVGDELVGDVMEECTQLLRKCGEDFNAAIRTVESAHPCPPGDADSRPSRLSCCPVGPVSVQFDQRTSLSAGARLSVFADEECSVELASFGGRSYATLMPATIPNGKFWHRMVGGGRDTQWGYRFTVSPVSMSDMVQAQWLVWMLGPTTLKEAHAMVLVQELCSLWTSVKLACPWRVSVGRFLACVLRTVGVVRGAKCVVDVVEGVKREVSWRVAKDGGREGVDVGEGKDATLYLQTLVEILGAGMAWMPEAGENGEAPMMTPMSGEDVTVASGQDRDLVALVKFCEDSGSVPTVQVVGAKQSCPGAGGDLERLLDMMRHLSEGCRLPDDMLCSCWLAARGEYAVRESSEHPYRVGVSEEGCVRFAGAQFLRVYLDGRCSSDGDDYLRFSHTEKQDLSGRLASYSGRFGVQKGGGDECLTVTGDSIWFHFSGLHGSDWGYRFVVVPEYSDDRRRELLSSDVGPLSLAAHAVHAAASSSWSSAPHQQEDHHGASLANQEEHRRGLSARDDGLIVRWVNQVQESHGQDPLSMPPASLTLSSIDDQSVGPGIERLLELPILLLRFRFAILQSFNALLCQRVLPYVDLSLHTQGGSLASRISSLRNNIFFDVKASFIASALSHTRSLNQDLPLVVLDRRSPKSVLVQMGAQLAQVPPFRLKGHEMAFRVQFTGEGAEGDNGPYRECISAACGDLESGAMGLLLPCPNATAGGNAPYQHTHIIRHSAASPSDIEMFALMGRLFGVAMRTKLPLDLHLNPLLWMRLVGQPPTSSHLDMVDAHAYRTFSDIAGGGGAGLCDQSFESGMQSCFEVMLSDGSTMELGEGGSERKVDWENRLEYAERAMEARVGEGGMQAAVVGRGLTSVVPAGLLCLLEWEELELLVTGRDEMDVQLLRQHTVYRGVCDTDELIKGFWDVLEGFSTCEKASFLRFVWGRSRLPRPTHFTETFKVHATPGCGDSRLPKADTCFFTLHLPHYSSSSILREKLLYAIKHCADMDLR